MNRSISVAGLLAISFVGVHQVSLAGPPLATDDTGVLDPGAWEFIVWAETDQRDSGDASLLPGFEANYGISETTAATVSLGRVVIDPDGESSKSDLSELTLEYKWLFHQGEQTALAFVPAYSFPIKDSAKDRGVIEDQRVVSLPLVGSYTAGDWEFTAQYAYELTSVSADGAFYGLSAAFSASDSLVLLAEVYNNTVLGAKADETNFNVGLDYSFGNGWAALFSIGSALDSDLSSDEELDTAAFFGIRYETR